MLGLGVKNQGLMEGYVGIRFQGVGVFVGIAGRRVVRGIRENSSRGCQDECLGLCRPWFY